MAFVSSFTSSSPPVFIFILNAGRKINPKLTNYCNTNKVSSKEVDGGKNNYMKRKNVKLCEEMFSVCYRTGYKEPLMQLVQLLFCVSLLLLIRKSKKELDRECHKTDPR